MIPGLAVLAHEPDPSGMPAPSPEAAILLATALPQSDAFAPPARPPSIRRSLAQASHLPVYIRIWSNSQSLAGPCPGGDGLPLRNPVPGCANAIPVFPDRAEE